MARDHDWRRARKLYERDGLSFTEIGKRIGATRRTVAIRAKAEAWVDCSTIARETADERREKMRALFVARDAEAVARNLEQKHEATSLATGIILRQLVRINGKKTNADALELRRLLSTLHEAHQVDASIAGLKDHDDWRPPVTRPDESSTPHADAVRAVLEEAARDGPDSGSDGPEGPVSDGS